MMVAPGVEVVTLVGEGDFPYETKVTFEKMVSDDDVFYYIDRISGSSVLRDMELGVQYIRKGLSMVLFRDEPSCVAFLLEFS